jgi:hypothetical protein
MEASGESDMAERCWHFQCPTCGIGDFELGRLAADYELVCEVCAEEGHDDVRLERWLSDDADRGHDALAA